MVFWRKKKPASPPQVGCFGKLPSTGDFIRVNAATDELAAFDRWLAPAVDLAKRALGPAWAGAYPPSAGLFIFRGDTQHKGEDSPARGIVGAWASSNDSAGRQYPMAVFGSYDYGQLVGTGASLPLALWPLLAACYDVATTCRSLTADAFVERVSRIELPSLADPVAASAGYRAWLATQTMRALWDTGFGTDGTRFWVVQNLIEAVEPFRGAELPKTGLALRLPLGAGDAYAVAVWSDIVLRLARWDRTLLNVFWMPRQTTLIHLGPPHVATFRELIAPTGISEHIAELCGVPNVDEPAARRRLGGLDPVVANTDLTIAGFLDGLSSG